MTGAGQDTPVSSFPLCPTEQVSEKLPKALQEGRAGTAQVTSSVPAAPQLLACVQSERWWRAVGFCVTQLSPQRPSRQRVPISSEHRVWCGDAVRARLLRLISYLNSAKCGGIVAGGACVSPSKEMKALKRTEYDLAVTCGCETCLSITTEE